MSWFERFLHRQQKTAGGGKTAGHLEVANTGSGIKSRIWAVGGGKGGVGKSLVTVNLGILLSRLGNKVLLIDADLGAANLHTFLGLEGDKASLSSFLKNEISDIRLLVKKTSVPNLDLISGAKDSLDVADISAESIIRLQKALRGLEFNYVILDIGPGTTSNMLDLFLTADEGVLLTTPEPTSIENTYRFLKCLVLRRIRNIINSQEHGELKRMLHKLFDKDWPLRIKTISDIIVQLKQIDPGCGEALKGLMGKTGVSFVLNQTRNHEDGAMGISMKKACHDYFGIEINFLGAISYDDSVVESIRLRRPLIIHYGQSPSALGIKDCLQNLLKVRTDFEFQRVRH